MSQELAPRANAEVAIQSPRDMIGVIARAAADPNVDPAKMQQLIDVQERLMKMAAEQQFNRDLVAMQGRIPQLARDGRIPNKAGETQSKFTRHETLDAVIRPLEVEYGFAMSVENPSLNAGVMHFVATLRHRDGHSEKYHLSLPVDSSGSKNGTQGGASTLSYARRHAKCMIYDIVTVDVDNDGRGDPPKPITEDQAMNIDTALADAGGNRVAFLKWLGVQKVADIPAARYKEAMDAIARAKNKKAGNQ